MQSRLNMGHTLEKWEHWNNPWWWNIDNQLIFPHWELLDVFREAPHQPGAITMQIIRLRCVLIRRVDWGNTKFSIGLSLSMSHIGLVWRDNDLNMLWWCEATDACTVPAGQGRPRWPESWRQRPAIGNPRRHDRRKMVVLPIRKNGKQRASSRSVDSKLILQCSRSCLRLAKILSVQTSLLLVSLDAGCWRSILSFQLALLLYRHNPSTTLTLTYWRRNEWRSWVSTKYLLNSSATRRLKPL